MFNSNNMYIILQKKATGQELMEKVNYQMDIIEKDYFGLQYTDHNHVSHWIDPTKPVKKQIKSKFSKLRVIFIYFFLESWPPLFETFF